KINWRKRIEKKVNTDDDDDDEEGDDNENPDQEKIIEDERNEKIATNYCNLVWEGSVLRPSFRNFRFENFATESEAKQYLSGHQVGHLWDYVKKYNTEDIE